MLNKMMTNKHAVSKLVTPALRAFGANNKPYAKDKIAHAKDLKEEVRPEFTQMYEELEMLMDRSKPMIK